MRLGWTAAGGMCPKFRMGRNRRRSSSSRSSAGVIDSQSVKTTESNGPQGQDAGTTIKGRTRHILTDTAKGYEVLPRRRVIERTFVWLSSNRRFAKNFEQTIGSATAWLFTTLIQLITRRIARARHYSR